MANTTRPSSAAGAGCLIVLAIPFAAVGVVLGVWFVNLLITYHSAQSWIETPAHIVRAELKAHRGKSTTYEVIAEYTYEFNGRKYQGTRVGIADNIRTSQRDIYRELSSYQRSGKPFHCFVNPAEPSQALLYRELRWEKAAILIMVLLVFGGLGFGMLFGGVAMYRSDRTARALTAAHPGRPWNWRPDWAAGRIVSSTKKAMVGTIVFALFWNLVTAPLWFVLPDEIQRKGNYWALLGLLFPAIGLILIGSAFYCFLRWRKFGQSEFQMASVPGVIGGRLAGVVRTSAKIRPEDGFHVSLRCLRRVTTGSGKSRHTTETVLWKNDQTVMHELLDDLTEVSAIPVEIEIPQGYPSSDMQNPYDLVIWRLVVSAAVPGIDYSATFEVPVFRVAGSDIIATV